MRTFIFPISQLNHWRCTAEESSLLIQSEMVVSGDEGKRDSSRCFQFLGIIFQMCKPWPTMGDDGLAEKFAFP